MYFPLFSWDMIIIIIIIPFHSYPQKRSSAKLVIANQCTHHLWQAKTEQLLHFNMRRRRNQLESGVGLVLRGCCTYFIPARLSPVCEFMASLAWLWTFASITGEIALNNAAASCWNNNQVHRSKQIGFCR